MSICERIKSLCDEQGLSIYRVEKDCGFGNGSLMKWETSSPKVENLVKIANYFEVSVDYLLGISNERGFISHKKSKQAVKEPLATTPHIVAHIDILGTKSMVADKKTSQKLLETMIGFIDKCKSYVKSFNELRDVAEKLSFKIFSDNIVIYIPFNKEKYNDLFQAICLSAIFFQRNLLLNEELPLPVRGGIAIENFYADDDFVYGQALIDSYQIEEKLAIVPRIVVSADIIETLFNKNELSQFAGYGKLIVDDFDGFYYLNFLYEQRKAEVEQIQKFIQKAIAKLKTKHAEQVVEKMKSGKDEVKDYSNIYQKYGWLLKYTCKYYDWFIKSQFSITYNVGLETITDDKKALAAEFAKTYEDLIQDESFRDTAKIFNYYSSEEIRTQILEMIIDWLAAYIQKLHIDYRLPNDILGRN